MAVRDFDGASRIVCSGTGTAICNDAWSIVAIVKPDELVADKAFVALEGAGSLLAALVNGGVGFAGRIGINTATSFTLMDVNLTADEWQIIAVTKAAGTTVTRGHRKALGSGGWTHVNSGGTLPNVATVCDTIEIGAFLGGAFLSAIDASVAAVAIYDAELSDGDIEAVETLPSSQLLVDLGALTMYNLNQASTATPVADEVFDADQISVTGTSVVTDDDPPGWDFSVFVLPPLDFSIRLSGGAANANPATSIGGAESSVEAGVNLFDDINNAERVAGLVDYRLVYVHNGDEADGTVVAYVSANLETDREIAIGLPVEDEGEEVTAVASDTTAPADVTFSAPSTVGGGLDLGLIPAGSFRGLWVRRTVNSGTEVDPTNFATIRFQTSRTE